MVYLPCWGAQFRCSFLSRGHSFLFFPRPGVSGVLLVVLSVVFYGTSLSDSCTCVCVSLVHSVVQILRFAFSVAVPLCSCVHMLLSSGHLVFGWIVGPTREARLIAYPPRGCSLRVRREQPVLDRHRPVSNLRGDLWPSLQGRLTLLLVSPPVSAGGVTRRSAPGQLCGLALLTRWTCPHLEGRLPYRGRPRQVS